LGVRGATSVPPVARVNPRGVGVRVRVDGG